MKTLLKISLLTFLASFVTNCSDFDNRFRTVSCSLTGDQVICPDGQIIDMPKDGVDGRDGAPGLDGNDGVDGADGINGRDGTQIELVDPCGDGPGVDEVVMIFGDGTVLAWYQNIGFSVLQEGVSYRTTDPQNCKFSILNGQVVEL